MIVYKTDFKDVMVFEPAVYNDERGSFKETYNDALYQNEMTNVGRFVQDNESVSKRGVFRGFHWQNFPMQQTKLVRVVKGRIIDIIICLIENSPNFKKYLTFELSFENRKQLLIPRGYAHGFVALEDDTIVNYKVDNYWAKEYEKCLSYTNINLSDIPEVNEIGVENLIISDKDRQGIMFEELTTRDLLYDANLIL